MHLMVDLETLAPYPGAAIVSIGACKFYWKDGEVIIHDKFYINVSAEDCKKHGLIIDPDIVEWWGKQSKEARAAWQANPQPLKHSLEAFYDWFGDGKNLFTWCNGASFDFPVLEVAFRKVELDTPWVYYKQNDFRTIINLFKLRNEWKAFCESGDTVYHNALDDAIRQARFLGNVLNEVLE